MISSVSGNRSTTWQTDYSQRQAAASSTANPDQDVQQDPTLKTDSSTSTVNKKTGELSESDLKVLSELKHRDSEVRTHEAAHMAAAGGIASGGPSFEYQQGPDGIQYAIGGEVNIDTSPVPGDPAATLRKADTIRRAALAPAEPSGPDMQVAASATAMAAQAQVELLKKIQDTQNGNKDHLGTRINLSA
ncbi:MAG: putative metalloprotease CJM1_0395 family protein [Methylobacter sp.]